MVLPKEGSVGHCYRTPLPLALLLCLVRKLCSAQVVRPLHLSHLFTETVEYGGWTADWTEDLICAEVCARMLLSAELSPLVMSRS